MINDRIVIRVKPLFIHIAGNQANNNLGDGIDIGGAGHTIRNNSASNNLAFGISGSKNTSTARYASPHSSRTVATRTSTRRRNSLRRATRRWSTR